MATTAFANPDPGWRARSIANPCNILSQTVDYFDVRSKDIRLSTAALLSARFPYISPAGLLQGPFFEDAHIVDGGYFDNSGVSANLEIYSSLLPWINLYNRSFHSSEKNKNVPIIVPIYIHIDNEYNPLAENLKKSRPISQILAPAQTIYLGKDYQTRNAIGRARKAFLNYLKKDGDIEPLGRFFHFNTFDLPGANAPLGWILSSSSMNELDSQIKLPENKTSLKGIRQLYNNPELDTLNVQNIELWLPEK